MAQVNIAVVIDGYLKLRKVIDDLKEEQKAAMAPFLDKKLKLEAFLMDQLNRQGVDSLSAKGIGTAFKQTATSVTAEDWPATLDWIKANEAWEMLERRVSKSAVQDYIATYDAIPPGLSIKTDIEVRVRKG